MTGREAAKFEAKIISTRLDEIYEALVNKGWSATGAAKAVIALARGGFFNIEKG